MIKTMHNLLTDPIISAHPLGPQTLPGVLAALVRDEIDGYSAMRPHQGMFWHMFCVQLAAMALAGQDTIPNDEDSWCALLRAMTPGYPQDEPWCLVVDDWTKPAFMQAAVPDDVELKSDVPTPDALDLLITSKNHDLKQAVAGYATPEDWLFALVTLQTGATHDVQNTRSVRTGNLYAPRVCIEIAPARVDAATPSMGSRFNRAVQLLTELQQKPNAAELLKFSSSGTRLTWLENWFAGRNDVGEDNLHPWFIEISRRVRLMGPATISAKSKAEKSGIFSFRPISSDPWTPYDLEKQRLFRLAEKGFGYEEVFELLFGNINSDSKRYQRSDLSSGTFDQDRDYWIIAEGLCGQGTKTGFLGHHFRKIPITGKVAEAIGFEKKRLQLHEIGKMQAKIIQDFRKTLGYALVTAVAGGGADRISRESYGYVQSEQSALDRYADTIFFPYLWRRFEAGNTVAGDQIRTHFVRDLWRETQAIFERALPTMPCGSLMRPKAENRARGALNHRAMKSFSDELKHKSEAGSHAA